MSDVAQWIKLTRAGAKAISGRHPRRGKLPRIVWPTAIETAYFGRLASLVDALRSAFKAERGWAQLADEARALHPSPTTGAARRDAGPTDDARKKIAQVRLTLSRGPYSDRNLEQMVQPIAQRISGHSREQLGRQLQAAVGVPVPIFDTNLSASIDAFTAQNVGLIQSIPSQALDQVQQVVLSGLGSGLRWEELADQIEQRFKVSESRAELIASDQVGKFFTSLNRTRQTRLGITHFVWATDDDERVCDECGPLDGKKFAWADTPVDEQPGHLHPLCRCNADPDVSGLLDDLD